MNDYLLAWNPDTGRCHGVPQRLRRFCPPEGLIRIVGVPKTVTLPEVCMLVERRKDIREKRGCEYDELCHKPRISRGLKKAG